MRSAAAYTRHPLGCRRSPACSWLRPQVEPDSSAHSACEPSDWWGRLLLNRLSGWDAMLMYSETPNVHNHTLKVVVVNTADVDGGYRFDVFRQTLARRMHLLDPMRYRLIDIPFQLHHPIWLEQASIDLDYHIRPLRICSPGGRRELDEVISDIASTPLDRTRPL